MENSTQKGTSKTTIILLTLGVVMILIAQTIPLEVENGRGEPVENNTKKIIQFAGIAFVFIGGIILARKSAKK